MRLLFKYISLFVSAVLFALPIHAQSEDANIRKAKTEAASAVKTDAKKLPDSLKWKRGGDVSLNFSQTHFSNWSGGGENSIALNTKMNLFANYKKNKVIWENNAYLGYGILKKGESKAVKNEDRIDVGSRLGYEMAKNWYYSLAVLGKTQFTDGYQYKSTDTTRISDFLAPMYVFATLGLDYKPSSRFSMALSPIMGKATFVRSNDSIVMVTSGLSADLIEKGKHARYEFGGGIIFNLKGDFFEKRVTYNTQLELFSNYLKNPQNVDVIWNFDFRIALTKFISAGVSLYMIYDDDQKTITKEKQADGSIIEKASPKLQVKELFSIGLFYDF